MSGRMRKLREVIIASGMDADQKTEAIELTADMERAIDGLIGNLAALGDEMMRSTDRNIRVAGKHLTDLMRQM